MQTTITRFAPSPTGYLHVGGARTALFNWLHARHKQGTFILRIEDTDRQRSTPQSVAAIFEALEWLGIDWDQGPFYQSERTGLYAEAVQQLIDAGHAYYCTCSPQKLEAMRESALKSGAKPKYDGTCRKKGLPKTEDAVVRLKAPLAGTTVLEDRIKGRVVFQNDELDDFILIRSNGSPTYNFVVVVDDIHMNINTVIRGDDHVMNTPRQMLLYRALNAPLPTFAHVPMVLGDDRTRLSKRHGAMSVTAYRDMGYLPEAFINYLARLGWSHGDQEFFSRRELIEKFSLAHIGRAAGIFDVEKLRSLNADHIQAAAPRAIAERLMPFLEQKGFQAQKGPWLDKVVETLMPRCKTLVDMADAAGFYFSDTVSYEPKAAAKFLKPAVEAAISELIRELSAIDRFSQQHLETAFKNVMQTTNLKLGKIAQPVRVALTGRSASPGIFEIVEIIGKQKVLWRLRQALDYIKMRKNGQHDDL